MPAPGVRVSLHPGPVLQRKTTARHFDGQGLVGPLVVLPLPLHVHLETLEFSCG